MGPRCYSKARTEFVRQKIKSAKWEKDKPYIDTLLGFEEIARRGGPWQWAQALAFQLDRQKYEEEWLTILKLPKNFYSLRAVPLQIAHAYGEPMYARVTLQNVGSVISSSEAAGRTPVDTGSPRTSPGSSPGRVRVRRTLIWTMSRARNQSRVQSRATRTFFCSPGSLLK